MNGLQYSQLKQVIHKDLSLKNILLTEDGNAKIADFGLAVKCGPNEKQTSILGTANFMPPIVTRTNSHNSISKYSCSHEYCLPEKNCHHKSSCYCHQSPVPIHKNNNTDHHSYERERKHVVEIRNSSADNGLYNVLTPLTTVRLKPSRYATKNIIGSILNDGQVCVEFLKEKNYVEYVCFVSCDGMKISIFKPKKKILVSEKPPFLPKNTEEVQNYSFENLPKIHWIKYKYAKRFVDIVRSQTPKLIIYSNEGKCVVMENAPCPDFEVEFYDGYKIRQSGNKITVMGENGICLTDEELLDAHIQFLLKTFKSLKEIFCESELILESLTSDEFDGCFPLIFGRRPGTASPRSTHSSSLNGTISMKSYSGTINTDCSPFPNTSPASIPSPLSNTESITPERDITDIMHALKRKPWIFEQWVIAEYEDNIRMWISLNGQVVFFCSMQTGECFSGDEHTKLMKRYWTDSRNILQHLLYEKIKMTK